MTSVAFREEPVDLTTFVTSPRYLALPRLSAAQYTVVQLAEKIFPDDTYAELAVSRNPATARYYAELADLPMVNMIIAQVGQGAGKDMMAALIVARIGYLLSCCESPQDAFGMARAAKIHLLNCAASAPQANEVFFAYLTGMVDREDSWFTHWFASRPKTEKAGCLTRSIGFGQGVIALSGHSDAATQQGLNLICAVADEIDEFKTDDVWNMAVSSAPSRFPREHKLIALSWPRRHGSKIQELTWRGRELGTDGGWHVIGPASTFAVNPTKTEAVFARFAAQNPALYAARYLCRPQLSANPVFPNEGIIGACFTPEARPRVRVVRYEREGAAYRPVWEVSHELLVPYSGVRYHLHIDASKVKDRTAVAMAHVASWQEFSDFSVDADGREQVRTGVRPVVALDFITTLTADMTAVPPRPIQPGDVLSLIRLLRARHFTIEVVSCDWYGLPYYTEPLTQLGIRVERLTTDLALRGESVWETLADVMYDGRLYGPYDPILARELRTLTRTDSGKIDHPAAGSKDAADAVACAVAGAVTLGGSESGPTTGKGHEFTSPDPEPVGGFPAGMTAGSLLPIGMGSAPRLSAYGAGFRPHH